MATLKSLVVFYLISCTNASLHEPRPSQNFAQSFRAPLSTRPSPMGASRPGPPPISSRPEPLPLPNLRPRPDPRPRPESRSRPDSRPNPDPRPRPKNPTFPPSPSSNEPDTKIHDHTSRSPVQRNCQRPPSRPLRSGSKVYWFSWRTRDLSQAQKTWTEARQVCQRFCMDLASIESEAEDHFLGRFMTRSRVYGLWTGGQICQAPGCVNDGRAEWVWEPVAHFINREDRYVNWSGSGAKSVAQPDDFTMSEKCLAVLNNWYGDGISWHDFTCEDPLPFVCEKVL